MAHPRNHGPLRPRPDPDADDDATESEQSESDNGGASDSDDQEIPEVVTTGGELESLLPVMKEFSINFQRFQVEKNPLVHSLLLTFILW